MPRTPRTTRPPRTRGQRIRLVVRIVGIVAASSGAIVATLLVVLSQDIPAIFESRVAAVEKRFADGFPQGGILLTGSSYFENWTTSTEDLQPLDTVNVGIGATKIGDQAAFMDRLVIPFHPRAVVIYAGSNDISGIPFFSKAGADVASRVQAYIETMHAKLPDAELFYVAITEAPIRAGVRDEIRTANALIADYAATTDFLTFIDTSPGLLTAAGAIDTSLFGPDSLHFNTAGYARFTSIVQPVLVGALG